MEQHLPGKENNMFFAKSNRKNDKNIKFWKCLLNSSITK